MSRLHYAGRLRVAGLVAALIVTAIYPLLALGQAATPTSDVIELPAPTGPFAVGRTSVDWVDPRRTELFTEDPGDQRELAIWVWYPAASTPDSKSAAYLPGLWGELLGPSLGFTPDQIVTHAIVDAPLSAEQAAYPVLILSPGSGFFAPAYASLAEELASHGYIVIGVTHPYNANVTVFADGRVVPISPAAQPLPPDAAGQGGTGDAITDVHAADLRFVLDQLERRNRQDGPLAGHLDLSRVGIFGHSLGGAAAAEVCRVDRRCDAAANMDGALWGEAAATGVPTPFLLLMSEHPSCREQAESGLTTIEDCEAAASFFTPGWETVYQAAQPGYWLVVTGSRHGSFSDLPFLSVPPAIAGPLLGGATIAPERMWRVTSDYLLAFFDQHLNGNPAPLLEGPSADYPDVEWVEGGS